MKYRDCNFDQFNCPAIVNPFLFSQLCVFHYMKVRKPTVNEIHDQRQIYMESITTDSNGEVVSKKTQNVNPCSDGCLGTAIIGKNHQLICVPGNSTITVPGH